MSRLFDALHRANNRKAAAAGQDAAGDTAPRESAAGDAGASDTSSAAANGDATGLGNAESETVWKILGKPRDQLEARALREERARAYAHALAAVATRVLARTRRAQG